MGIERLQLVTAGGDAGSKEGEVDDLELAARTLSNFSDLLLNTHGVVLHERLLQETNFCEVLAQLALYNAFQNLGGLVEFCKTQ